MKHGSLFSGIGGFDLAAQKMGWENVFHCEWNTFSKKILQYYWPTAISYGDIRKTDFTVHRGKIDIITGGFPCQPYSLAGKRLGKEDDRHLWPEMLRAIREIKPTWVVGENVYGLINWSGGLVFNEVQTDLEAEGYSVQPIVLPACAVNAPHRRDRIWFVATNSDYNRKSRKPEKYEGESPKKGLQEWYEIQQSEKSSSFQPTCESDVSNSNSFGQPGKGRPEQQSGTRSGKKWKASWSFDDDRWPTQSPICSGDDGLSDRLVGITFPKFREESIKAYGNAVVPQVVLQIFKTIEDFEKKSI